LRDRNSLCIGDRDSTQTDDAGLSFGACFWVRHGDIKCHG